MTAWQRHFKGVFKHRSRLEVSAVFVREGEQYDVEPSCAQLCDERRRQVFDEIKPEGRIGATQPGRTSGSKNGPTVAITPIRRVPLSGSLPARAASTRSFNSLRMRRAL